MKTFRLFISFLFMVAILVCCSKNQDSDNPFQVQMQAHTWVFDSSNTLTIINGTGDSVITRTKGDSSQTLTYYAKTFVTSDGHVTKTKKYRMDKTEVYYWDAGYQEYSAQKKYVIAVDDSTLVEQVIMNQILTLTKSTSSFLFYHAK